MGHSVPHRTARKRRGFTLIEILAVVLIIGLAMSFLLPNLDATRSSRLRQRASDIASRIELARERSIVTGVPHRVLIDLGAGGYRVDWFVTEDVAYASLDELDGTQVDPSSDANTGEADVYGNIEISLSPPVGDQADLRGDPPRRCLGRSRRHRGTAPARHRADPTMSDLAGDPRSGRVSAGFTLLEVLAALMILGLWYTAISGLAMQGVHSEFVSNRKLMAAQLADRAITEIETQAMLGAIPAIEEHILQDDEEFSVVVAVSEFGGADEGEAPPGVAGGGDDVAPTELAALIVQRLPGLPSLLLTVTVRVSWTEGNARRELKRVSYLFDETAATAIYQESGLGEFTEASRDTSSSAGLRQSEQSGAQSDASQSAPSDAGSDRERSRPANR